MAINDPALMKGYSKRLKAYCDDILPMPGVASVARRTALSMQIVDSVHRIRYIDVIRKRKISPSRVDPSSENFDPIKGAILKYSEGEVDEAFWLIFLFAIFGKHLRDGYRLLRDVYRAFGSEAYWTWARVSADPEAFEAWLEANEGRFLNDGEKRRFGNHRKYTTLKTTSPVGVANAIKTYVSWVGPNVGHKLCFELAETEYSADQIALFDGLYHSLDVVASFGRTTKFDYLTMLGKLGFVAIAPGLPYLHGASGPLFGARLLFLNDVDANGRVSEIEQQVVELGQYLDVGMQVMEDALCNWQKSPDSFVPFRG